MSIVQGDSPFKHVLNTNYSASAEETRLITSMLKDSRQILHGIDKDIDALRATLTQRINRRNKLAARMNAHRALISPIRRLSPKLISEIFYYCLSDEHNPVRSITEAPLLLTRICRSWRDIAMSNPRLWNSIHIHVPYVYNDETTAKAIGQRRLGVDRWLNMSGSLPISLSLCTTFSDYHRHHSGENASDTPEPSAYAEFMRTLLQPQFSSRWRHLDLKLSSAVLNNWLPLKGQGLSSLHTLKVDFGEDFCWSVQPADRSLDFSLDSLICEAPNLRVFSLCNYVHNPYLLPVIWENLTDLTLKSFCHSPEGLTSQQVLDILSRTSQSLRSCSVHVSFPIPYSEINEEQEIINLPALRTFEIKFAIFSTQTISTRISEKEVGNIFNYIIAPSLADLNVQVSCGHPNVMNTMSSMPFLPFLARSSCDLSSLNIELPISNDALTECLRLTPKLASLSIVECRWIRMPMLGIQLNLGPLTGISNEAGDGHDGPVICDDLLKVLTPNSSNPILSLLCPNLERLKLAKCGPLSGEALINLAKSRWNIQGPGEADDTIPGGGGEDKLTSKLQYLDVALYVSKSEDLRSVKSILPEVRSLKEQGMKFTLSYPQERPRAGKDSPWTGLPSDSQRNRSPFGRLF